MRHELIGSYPPPLGGVSVFLYRRRRQLADRGEPVVVLDYGKLGRWRRAVALARLLLDPRPRAFDLNEFNFSVMAMLMLRPFPGAVTFRDHAFRLLGGLRGARRLVFRAFLRRTDRVVLVNEALRAYYASHGYALPEATAVEPAFLPPPLDEEAGVRATYDEETLHFTEMRRPLLIANAFRITFHEGVDLYGIDLCIALVDEIRQEHPGVGLLVALAEVGDPAYLAKLQSEISHRGLDAHVHFMTGQRELWPLLKAATVLLRPTNTDGDAISIREALYFGRPVVASDVVPRPVGTVVFKSRDLASFIAATRRVLAASSGAST